MTNAKGLVKNERVIKRKSGVEVEVVFGFGAMCTAKSLTLYKYEKSNINMGYYSENCIENMIMEECLDELDEQEHQIIMLYYWWGYRDAEIGKFLSESQQMVNYKRNRALRKIKSAISK